MAADLTMYDLFWVYPLRHLKAIQKPVAIEQRGGSAANVLDSKPLGIPACILYPALLTPDIVVRKSENRVELLMLTKDKVDLDKLRQFINHQLKACAGLISNKPYADSPLFSVGKLEDLIRIEPCVDLATGQGAGMFGSGKPYKTGQGGNGRFSGWVSRHAVKLYKDAGFGNVYPVSIDLKMFDVLSNPSVYLPSNYLLDGAYIVVGDPKAKKQDWNQDQLVADSFKTSNIDKEGRYGFPLVKGDVLIGEGDPATPVQSHHPVFLLEPSFSYLNLGHMGDIHLSSRQNLMARSEAKVIEHSDFPALGSRINVCSQRVKELLDQFSQPTVDDDKIHAVVLGGDLVDFTSNAYDKDFATTKNYTVSQIWKLVDAQQWSSEYRKKVDFLSIYSLIIDFYRNATMPKPIFAITGNHDGYLKPYGISPRRPGGRANPGIPADHNLTIYEAILLYCGGDRNRYGFHASSWTAPSPIDKDEFVWFYTLFSPFTDFSLELSNQILVALGWGDDECMIDINDHGQGKRTGHLPRASESVSNQQLELLNKAIEKKKKLTLTTHFTFVSYEANDPIPIPNNVPDGVARLNSGMYSWHTMGIFENNRDAVFKKLLPGSKEIQLVLTGHSHRRAIYTLDKYVANQSVETHMVDYLPEGNPVLPGLAKVPLIVVSDSGGPVPRRIMKGEFEGWGSDPPSGTKIVFDASGEISAIKRVKSKLRPRFVVALDYLDVVKRAVITSFETAPFKLRSPLPPLTFTLQLNPDNATVFKGVQIDQIKLYSISDKGVKKIEMARVSVSPDGTKYEFTASAPADVPAGALERFFIGNQTSETFAAVQFFSDGTNPVMNSYDFSDPWTFEIQIKETIATDDVTEKLEIARSNPEIPEFQRRNNATLYPYH